jgi:hypothetical protein
MKTYRVTVTSDNISEFTVDHSQLSQVHDYLRRLLVDLHCPSPSAVADSLWSSLSAGNPTRIPVEGGPLLRLDVLKIPVESLVNEVNNLPQPATIDPQPAEYTGQGDTGNVDKVDQAPSEAFTTGGTMDDEQAS